MQSDVEGRFERSWLDLNQLATAFFQAHPLVQLLRLRAEQREPTNPRSPKVFHSVSASAGYPAMRQDSTTLAASATTATHAHRVHAAERRYTKQRVKGETRRNDRVSTPATHGSKREKMCAGRAHAHEL